MCELSGLVTSSFDRVLFLQNWHDNIRSKTLIHFIICFTRLFRLVSKFIFENSGKPNYFNAHDVGRRLIREGALSTDEILNKVLLQARFDPEHQQYALVTLKEMTPQTYTGDSTIFYKGSITGRGISVQGNFLTNKKELKMIYEAVVKAQNDSLSLYEILMLALEAGSKGGGDKRCGKQKSQSAFMVVAKPEDDEKNPFLRLVVRDERKGGENAVAALRKEYEKWKKEQVNY
jgi:uncharacterized Ntn-hydrolase superfamily protein